MKSVRNCCQIALPSCLASFFAVRDPARWIPRRAGSPKALQGAAAASLTGLQAFLYSHPLQLARTEIVIAVSGLVLVDSWRTPEL